MWISSNDTQQHFKLVAGTLEQGSFLIGLLWQRGQETEKLGTSSEKSETSILLQLILQIFFFWLQLKILV